VGGYRSGDYPTFHLADVHQVLFCGEGIDFCEDRAGIVEEVGFDVLFWESEDMVEEFEFAAVVELFFFFLVIPSPTSKTVALGWGGKRKLPPAAHI
jgi:hypothetical protein